MLPPAISRFSALLKEQGYTIDLFDTTYHKIDGKITSDEEKTKHLQVRPFNLEGSKIKPKSTDVVEDFLEKITTFDPDLIAVSVVEDMFALTKRLLKAAREKKNILTIMGGVFPTFAPEKAIAIKGVDIICVGEGEYALVDLCNKINEGENFDNIPGLWIKKKNKKVIRNKQGSLVDISNTALPDFTIFEEARLYRPMAGKVYRMIPFETQRGCPYTCSFCNSPMQNILFKKNIGKTYYRSRTMESIRREMDFLIKTWKPEYMYFTADTFLAWSPKQFDEFVETYSDYKLPFWIQTRAETITPYYLKKLKEVGLHRMSIGLEHGNEKFRKEVVSRNYPNAVIIKAFNIAANLDIPVTANNIIGFPYENRELAFDTIELNRKVADCIDTANCNAFTPFHGTKMRGMALEAGYIDNEVIGECLNAGSILNMPDFPSNEIKGLMRTFNLYLRYPRSAWPEIRLAEENTPKGNAIFEKYREEFISEWYSGESVS